MSLPDLLELIVDHYAKNKPKYIELFTISPHPKFILFQPYIHDLFANLHWSFMSMFSRLNF